MRYIGSCEPPTRPTHVHWHGRIVEIGARSWPPADGGADVCENYTCVVPQHEAPQLWSIYEHAMCQVLVCFCSTDCANAFELDPGLILGLEGATRTR